MEVFNVGMRVTFDDQNSSFDGESGIVIEANDVDYDSAPHYTVRTDSGRQVYCNGRSLVRAKI